MSGYGPEHLELLRIAASFVPAYIDKVEKIAETQPMTEFQKRQCVVREAIMTAIMLMSEIGKVKV